MKNKLLTVVFIDMCGYTLRMSQQARNDNEFFIKGTQHIVEVFLKDKEGVLVKTLGDGFLATFESPTNAVLCSKDLQKAARRRNMSILNKEKWLKFRIGIDVGEVSIDENGDIYGETVNIASRLQEIAQPEEILISEIAYLTINKNEIKTKYQLEAKYLGRKKLKNVSRKIRVYKIVESAYSENKREKANYFLKMIVFWGIVLFLLAGASLFLSKFPFLNKKKKLLSFLKKDKNSACKIKGIVFSHGNYFVMVDRQLFGEEESICGVKILKILPDKVIVETSKEIKILKIGERISSLKKQENPQEN